MLTPLLTLLLATSVLANMGPPKPAKTIGPSVLTDCGCTSFTDIVTSCQTSTSLSATSCICDSTWYGASMSCRDCLLTANGAKFGTDDPTEMFYDSFGQAITNIFVACTEKGASVKVADGTEPGICGWNSFGGWACVGFDQDKGTGWASEVDSSTKEVRLGRAEVVLAGAQVSASASASASATKTGSSSGVVGLATGSSSAEASSTATKASIWINNAESAVPSASSTPIDNTGNNASPDLRSGLGSSMALVAVVVLLVAAF